MPIKPITVYVKDNKGKVTPKKIYLSEDIKDKNICINFYAPGSYNRILTIKNGELNKTISAREFDQLSQLFNADGDQKLSLNDFDALETKKEALSLLGYYVRDDFDTPQYEKYMSLADQRYGSGIEIYIPKSEQ